MSNDNANPISVTGSGAKVATRETFKTLFVAGFAVAATRLVNSEVAMVAVIPAGGVLAVLVYGVIERIYHWRVVKYLADLVPDEVAKVERK